MVFRLRRCCCHYVLTELPRRWRRLSASAMHHGDCQLLLIAGSFVVVRGITLDYNTELWILCRFLYTQLWDAIQEIQMIFMEL